MPMVTVKRWELIHEWVSKHWKEEWTNERMMDEINSLDEFRVQNIPSTTLKELMGVILKNGVVRKGNVEYNFKNLQSVFESWNHLTTNCIEYGRIWVAQDESYLACLVDEHRNCKCSDYKPMINCKSLEELVSEEKVEFT